MDLERRQALVKKLASLGRFVVRLAIAAIVAAFIIFVRLAYGPVPVDRLGETIAEPFEAAFPGSDFAFDGAFLQWSWDQFAFVFTLDNTRVTNPDGTTLANFPNLGVSFAGGQLLVGKFFPTRVSFEGPELHFDWDAVKFGAAAEAALLNPDDEQPEEEDDERPPVIRFMETLIRGEGEDSPLRDLTEVSIKNAQLTLTEKNIGVVWKIPRGDLVITRAGSGLAFDANFDFLSRNELIEIAMRSEQNGAGLSVTSVSMEGLNIAVLAREVALGSLFETIDMPLYGTFEIWQNQNGGVSQLQFDIGGGPGTIFHERINSEPAHFEDVVFKGQLHPGQNLISLEALRLAANGDVITGDGYIEFTEEGAAPALRMVLAADRLKIDTFLQLWPTAKRSGGRDWIAGNIENGVLQNVRAELAFKPDTWGQKPLPNEAMHITLDFAEGNIHFLRPMPPVENARGHLMLEGNEMHTTLYEGVVDGMTIRDLQFDIEDLTKTRAQVGFVRFRATDDLQRLMRFVDQEPLNVFAKQGLDPADYFGEADLEARIQVPLYSGAPPEDLSYTIEGRVVEAAVPSLMAGGGLTEGDMKVTITPTGLLAQGAALLKGVPFDFYWTQDFAAGAGHEFTTRIELSGALEDTHLHTFGLPDDLTMEGTARVYLTLRGRDGDLVSGQGTADFFNAKVDAAKMDWHKRANRRAEAGFDLEWTETELLVKNVEITSPEFTMKGGFIFDKEEGLMKRADVPVFITPINDLTATARQRDDGVLDVTVQARALNAMPYLEGMFEDAGEESFAPDMRLVLLATRVFAMNEVVYQNVSIEANKRREFWTSANVIGAIDEGGVFQLALINDDEGRHLTLESDNAGRLALGTDIFRNATGGRLRLNADMNVFQDPLFAEGVLSATGFRMVKSSALIQALSEEEKSGLDEMIREEGMEFSELTIPFRLEDNIIDISDASARGEQFGFTMEGEVDQDFYRMNLNGTIVPAYSLNTFISRIPIIGTIIAGGSGEGLFALNYRITGNREEPNVDFKEMSAVAPGILRKILGGQKKGRLEPLPSLREESPEGSVEETAGPNPEPEAPAEPKEGELEPEIPGEREEPETGEEGGEGDTEEDDGSEAQPEDDDGGALSQVVIPAKAGIHGNGRAGGFPFTRE